MTSKNKSFQALRTFVALAVSTSVLVQPVLAQQYTYRAPVKGFIKAAPPPDTEQPPTDPTPPGTYALTSTTSSLSISGLAPGDSGSASVTVMNSGNAAASGLSVAASGEGFSATSTCPTNLTAGTSCSVTATFTSPAQGVVSASGSISVRVAGTPALTLPVTVSGGQLAPALSLTPQSVVFSDTTIGTSSGVRTITVRNISAAALTVSGVDIALGRQSFGVSNNCGSPLAPNSTCSLDLLFTPVGTAGGRSGALAVTAGTQTYTASLSGNATDPVQVAPVLGSFSVPAKQTNSAPFPVIAPSSDSTGEFTFTSSNTDVATVAGSTIVIVGAGSTTITANQAATAFHTAASISALLEVSSIAATHGAFNLASRPATSPAFTVTPPASNSDGPFTYTSSNPSVATVSGSTVTPVGVGVTTITASQAATSIFGAAATSTSFEVTGAATTLGAFTVPAKQTSSAPFVLSPPTSNSNGAFTYSSSNPSVATVAGNTVTIVGAGSTTLTASQAATSVYAAASTTATLTVTAVEPTLGAFTVPAKQTSSAPFVLTPPTSNSNGAFTYSSSNPAVATVAGSTVTIVGGGSTTITASQAATSVYTAASTTATLTVTAVAPTLGAFTIPAKQASSAPFALSPPTSNSNGAFSYSSSNTNVATVSGNTVTIVGVGTTTITANQAATTSYTSASTTATLDVSVASPTFGAFVLADKQTNSAPFTLSAPTSNSPGAFTFTSEHPTIASVSGNTVTVHSAGTATIRATQAATANFAGGSITATLRITQYVLPAGHMPHDGKIWTMFATDQNWGPAGAACQGIGYRLASMAELSDFISKNPNATRVGYGFPTKSGGAWFWSGDETGPTTAASYNQNGSSSTTASKTSNRVVVCVSN